MPLRLPTRRRPEEPAPFRRRTPPTPQATRLMKLSLASGLLFVLVLAVVFIPPALRYGDVRPPVVYLAVSGTGPFNVTVTSVSARYALNTYYVWLNVTGSSPPVACGGPTDPLESNVPKCGGALTFVDVDADGVLSFGDRFVVQRAAGTSVAYALSVFHTMVDQRRPECPCFVGVARWP